MDDTLLNIKKLDQAWRILLPQLALAFFILFSFTSLPLPWLGNIKPQFVLMLIYYWAIYRPTLVPPALCFAAGLLLDIFAGGQLGVNALILILMQQLVRDQRRYLMGQSFITIWVVFGFVILLSTMLQWVMFGVANGYWAELRPLAINAGFNFFLFPLVTMLIVLIHKILPVASRRLGD